MSARSDEAFTRRYEADKAWYEQLVENEACATDRQRSCIYAIQKKKGAPEFDGWSKKDATEYINKWG